MPDKSSSTGPNKTQQEFSLGDLLPDLLDTPPSPAPSPIQPPVTSYETPKPSRVATEPLRPVSLGELKPLLLGLLGLILLPLIGLGIFLLIANSQPLPSAEELARAAQTPVPTVFSVSPPPTAQIAATPVPANCAAGPAFGPLDAYPCARQMAAPQNWDAFFSLADAQLSQSGVRLVGTAKRYDVTADRPDRVLAFYAKALKDKGFTPTRPTIAGGTPIGDFRSDQYAKGSQQVQILALSLNRASPDASAQAGETVIRFNTN